MRAIAPVWPGWAAPRVQAMARPAAIAVAVAVAYYVGARVGFLLTVPPLSPSLLWPPNAILTATLLLASPRRWGLYLLATFPAHLAVQLLGTSRPTALVLALFLTNCSEAIVAATVVRRFAGHGPAVFHSLRTVVVFTVGAGLVAPLVSSFLDAAVVALLRGDAYWLGWRTRIFANSLTALTLVPVLVMVAGRSWSWRRPGAWRKALEGTVLWLGLSVVAWSVFGEPTGSGQFDVVLTIPLAFIVPFLLWAAVRLGPTGTSLSLLTVEVLAIWGGTSGRGPFAVLSPADNVLSVQIMLIVLAIPLMCLAALIEESRRGRRALEDRLRFEEVLSRLSRAFVHLPSEDVDRTIDIWLRRLGEHLGVRHITIFQLSNVAKSFVPTHSWTAQPQPTPWLELSGVDDGDPNDLPLLITDSGVLSFGAHVDGAPWSAARIAQARLVAEVFGNALARKQAEDALRLSETMNAAILSSLASSVAVLDQRGRVVALNEGWAPLLGERDAAGVRGLGLGSSPGDVCRLAIGSDSPYVATAVAGIQSVIDGIEPSFLFEWPRDSASVERWFEMTVVPLHPAEGGAVVSLTDITRRKQVEVEAQRMRQELAHFTRVSAMGELAASLAHELNQPLAGILANAQAGQRFLATGRAGPDEIRAILADIVADDRRAGEVIRRLREMLRKAAPSRVQLDLNGLIGDVVKMLSSDALIRGLSIVLDVDPKLPAVAGDRVELQQVVLNLLVNAMEAMTGPAAVGRLVVVRTACGEPGTVEVAVQDAGTGVAAAGNIFEPFYTTKAEGLGMGLSIARSIIEAHGGRIWTENNSTGGATFHFALAAASPETP